MSTLRNILIAGVLAISSAATATFAGAAPISAPMKVESSSDVVQARVVCNGRNCQRVWNGRNRVYVAPRRYYAPRRVYIAPRRYYAPRTIYVAPRPVYVAPRVVVRRGYDAHVRWCLARYGSYNPRTDRFLAYDGRYKLCLSPYR